MAKVIYKPGDIIPIVLNVLHICFWSYACNTFKIAVKDYFPDLKGITETDMLDDASVALLDSVDEGLIPLIRVSIEYFGVVREAISNLYGLDADQFLNDKRLLGGWQRIFITKPLLTIFLLMVILMIIMTLNMNGILRFTLCH